MMTDEPLQGNAMEEYQSDKLPDIAVQNQSQQEPIQDREEAEQTSLPKIQLQRGDESSSSESLTKTFGLTEADEKSLGRLLKTVRGEVLSTMEELRTITTHDDNLERQYKETVIENTKLNSALEKARGEIRHLKGRLSVLQMTSPEIRKFHARTHLRERRRQIHEKQLQQSRLQYSDKLIPLLNVAERARTVNARGEYIDYRWRSHSRHLTYPPPCSFLPLNASSLSKSSPLPPPLQGCKCSVCNSQQSLGALTLGNNEQQHLHITKSGQQILLGDRVIVKGDKPGTVKYVGKLETGIQRQFFIGVHLDMPVGTCDGSLKGYHYFWCPRNHGVFVTPKEIICVTGRKPHTGASALPRIQEQLPASTQPSRSPSKLIKTPLLDTQSPATQSTCTPSTMTQAYAAVESELAKVHNMLPDNLFHASVVEMSHKITVLSKKKKSRPITNEGPIDNTEEQKMDDTSHRCVDNSQQHSSKPNTPIPQSPSPSPEHKQSPSPPEITAHNAEQETTVTPLAENVSTPFETLLLTTLQSKDLGNTGYVTGKEIASCLTHLPKGKSITEEQAEELLYQLGVYGTSGSGGLPYHTIIPHLVQAVENLHDTVTSR